MGSNIAMQPSQMVGLFMSVDGRPFHPTAEPSKVAGRRGRSQCIISLKEPGREPGVALKPCQVEVLVGSGWWRIELIYNDIYIYIINIYIYNK